MCDTKDILKYFTREYPGQLDELFANNSIKDILYKLKSRNDHYYHHKRDLSAVNAEFINERVRRAAPSGDKESYGKNPLDSVLLLEVAHACRYGSIALLSCMILIVSSYSISNLACFSTNFLKLAFSHLHPTVGFCGFNCHHLCSSNTDQELA